MWDLSDMPKLEQIFFFLKYILVRGTCTRTIAHTMVVFDSSAFPPNMLFECENLDWMVHVVARTLEWKNPRFL
jgi:hypothetical protein